MHRVSIGLLAALACALATMPAQAAPPAATAAQDTVRVLIVPSREARLAAQMQGRLVSLTRSVGSSFKKGDVLAEFDCGSERAELAMASARVIKADKTLASQESMKKLNAASELDIAIATSDVAEAKARVQQAQASVAKCSIVAPYNGRVVRRLANQYESIGPGTPVLEVVETGAIRLEMIVPSRWLGWLKVGHTFTVKVDELGREVPAKVTAIGAKVDAASQTVMILAEFLQPVPGILPGMSGSAKVPGNKGG